jgi:hypothetical protein
LENELCKKLGTPSPNGVTVMAMSEAKANWEAADRVSTWTVLHSTRRDD